MKKTLVIIAVACLALQGLMAADRFTETITVAAGATNATVTFPLYRADGPPATTIDTLCVVVDSGSGTGVVTFASYDYGVATTIATSGSIKDGEAYATQPYNTLSALYTYPVVESVVTGNVVLARQNLQTNYTVTVASPIARQLKVSVAQAAVADATVYKVAVYVKENPPVPLHLK
jgi:hypothetical protein